MGAVLNSPGAFTLADLSVSGFMPDGDGREVWSLTGVPGGAPLFLTAIYALGAGEDGRRQPVGVYADIHLPFVIPEAQEAGSPDGLEAFSTGNRIAHGVVQFPLVKDRLMRGEAILASLVELAKNTALLTVRGTTAEMDGLLQLIADATGETIRIVTTTGWTKPVKIQAGHGRSVVAKALQEIANHFRPVGTAPASYLELDRRVPYVVAYEPAASDPEAVAKAAAALEAFYRVSYLDIEVTDRLVRSRVSSLMSAAARRTPSGERRPADEGAQA